jgi:hypothetical protein
MGRSDKQIATLFVVMTVFNVAVFLCNVALWLRIIDARSWLPIAPIAYATFLFLILLITVLAGAKGKRR